jgi:hypothetical protein
MEALHPLADAAFLGPAIAGSPTACFTKLYVGGVGRKQARSIFVLWTDRANGE